MVEFGLYNVAGSPNLTFIFFVGLVLLVVLGIRFAYYAHRNRTATSIETQTPIWTNLQYIGLLAALFGLAGVLEIVSSLQLPYKSAALLATTLALAFAIRDIHTTATHTTEETDTAERAVRAAFVAVVIVEGALLFQFGLSALTAGIEGLSAVGFLLYGVAFYRRQMSETRLQGTMLDSLLRHLLPILTFAALTSIVSLAIVAGLDRIVVLHVQVVFIIMTATALMTGTIKLRQNLASL